MFIEEASSLTKNKDIPLQAADSVPIMGRRAKGSSGERLSGQYLNYVSIASDLTNTLGRWVDGAGPMRTDLVPTQGGMSMVRWIERVLLVLVAIVLMQS
ncbi:MAG: hypothetical protein Q8S75_10370, partial [Nitrospirota bacterium]|nr:hypothetical protein [Nitrospirota bacterium]